MTIPFIINYQAINTDCIQPLPQTGVAAGIVVAVVVSGTTVAVELVAAAVRHNPCRPFGASPSGLDKLAVQSLYVPLHPSPSRDEVAAAAVVVVAVLVFVVDVVSSTSADTQHCVGQQGTG